MGNNGAKEESVKIGPLVKGPRRRKSLSFFTWQAVIVSTLHEKQSMKNLVVAATIVVSSLLQATVLCAQDSCCSDSVVAIDEFNDLYRHGTIFISGQPDRELFEWFRSQGVTQVINLRTPGENRKFRQRNFDAAKFVLSLGMDYTSVPVGGSKKDNQEDKLGKTAAVLNKGEPSVLYCKSGGRARYMFMSYLVREKDCTPEMAKRIARQMGYFFSLELFFGKEIKPVDE